MWMIVDSFPPRFWSPRPPDAPYCPERNFARPCGKSVKAQTGDKEEGGTEEPSMLRPSKKNVQTSNINVATSMLIHPEDFWSPTRFTRGDKNRLKSLSHCMKQRFAYLRVAYSMFSPSLEVREIFREASLGDSRESIDPVNSEHSSDSSPANSSSHQSWSSCKELAQEGTGRTALPMYVKILQEPPISRLRKRPQEIEDVPACRRHLPDSKWSKSGGWAV